MVKGMLKTSGREVREVEAQKLIVYNEVLLFLLILYTSEWTEIIDRRPTNQGLLLSPISSNL